MPDELEDDELEYTVEMARTDRPLEWWPLEPHNGDAEHESLANAVGVRDRVAREFGPGFLFRVTGPDAPGHDIETGAGEEE
jgi:hypothetical protein